MMRADKTPQQQNTLSSGKSTIDVGSSSAAIDDKWTQIN
jgi:hypothetical protein